MSTKDWISKVSFAKPSCWSFVDFDDHFQRFERLKKLEVHTTQGDLTPTKK